MEDIKVVELFAGVGGFRLGLERSSERYKTVWANQWEPTDKSQNAFKCYQAHFGGHPYHVCEDIAKVIDKIPEHDLLVGGFPCQDYSVAKSGAKGIEGEKGALWWQIEKIIKTCRPRCVVLENVDRMIRSPSKQKGRDFSMILRSFYEAHYMVEWRVINAADYGQVQRRKRIFIVALRNDTEEFKELATAACTNGSKGMRPFLITKGVLAKAFPVCENVGPRVGTFIDEASFCSMKDIFDSMKIYLYNSGLMMNGWVYSEDLKPISVPQKCLADILIPEVDKRFLLKEQDMEQWKYLKGSKSEMRNSAKGRQFLFSEGAVPFPDRTDRPARTMLTSEGSVNRSSHVVRDKKGNLRTLSPVECERLNGFPDGWTEMLPEKYRYFTMGNALVVPIVTAIADQLLNIL